MVHPALMAWHGIARDCTPAARKNNMAEMVSKEEGSEAIVAKVMKDTVGEGKDSVGLKQLKGGSSLTVSLVKRMEESVGQVDSEVAAKLKKGLDLSGKDLKKSHSHPRERKYQGGGECH